MSEYTTQDAVRSAMSGNVADFKDAVNDLLTQKVQSALELKKLDVSANFMSSEVDDEIESEPEEYEIDTEGETDDQEV